MIKKIFHLLIFCIPILAQSKADKIDQLLKIYVENRQFSGAALVAENGKVIYSKAFGYANMEWDIPNTPDTKFRLGSVTKQFTSAIIMQLVEQGKLKLDNKISDILPDYPRKTGDKITIHQLLTHSSGLLSYTDIPEYFKDNYVRKNMKPQEIIDLFKDKELKFEPGTQFEYSNSGYIVLGVIIEKITGKPYEQVLKENILDPAGMTNTGYDHMEKIIKKRAAGYDRLPDGYKNCDFVDMSSPYSAGALYSTSEDLFKWDQALYTDKLISEESKKKIFTGYFDVFEGMKYCYGWMTKYVPTGKNDSTRIVVHGGGIFGFNAVIVRQIEKNNCIILLNNTPAAQLGRVTDQISNILYDLPYDMPKKSAADKLYTDYAKEGIEKAAENYEELMKSGSKEYDFSESELNRLGYNFMLNKKLKESLIILKLNADLNPNSANVYDSYGEALLANGDTTAAIGNYKKSLELNKNNLNAVTVLKSLNVDVSAYESISPELLESYCGRYQVTPQLIVEITTENGKIYAQPTGADRFEIYPETPTRFYLKVGDAKADFVKEGNKVTHFILHRNGQDLKCMRIE
ncbi:MAG TPA: serine hydrolase [Ignavibacteriaceae bacterium]|nr:serine hydrolase [Ignavibacteriaceae bacterium]